MLLKTLVVKLAVLSSMIVNGIRSTPVVDAEESMSAVAEMIETGFGEA